MNALLYEMVKGLQETRFNKTVALFCLWFSGFGVFFQEFDIYLDRD